jgi:hypothetical protein
MLRILLAGNDSRLLATRAAVLAKTGASVVYGDARETFDALDREAFDLVVLCHSLLESDVAMIADVVHAKIPDAKILMVAVNRDGMDRHSKCDAISMPEPTELLARTRELLAGVTVQQYL